MPLTLANSNYNGEVFKKLHVVNAIGNEMFEKGVANVHTDISTKEALPRLSQTDNPLGDYQEDVPTSETVTTTYAERELVVLPATMYETFNPATFKDLWQEFKSQGDFTNMELNSKLLKAILDRYRNGIGTQVSKLFWQGDITLGAGNAMNKFNGIITRAIADANVIKPTPQGNITSTSFPDILAAVWSAIPDKFLDDPNFVLHVNTTDWKTMMNGNTNLKKEFVGIFGTGLEEMYQMKRIKHFQGMKRHHIFGAHATTDDTSNLHFASWVNPDNEAMLVDKVSNNSRKWFVRLDTLMDANYSASEECVLYEPA